MTDLLNALQESKPREKAGGRTTARYEFQAHVAIIKIIDLHETGKDYRAAFEHFDDLMILNSSTAPDRVEFYQVKSKSAGRWTMRALTHIDTDAPPPRSILGKMYHNVALFEHAVERIGFISNAGFDFILSDNKSTNEDNILIFGKDLHTNERAKIDAAISADFSMPMKCDCKDILLFEQTSFGPRDQDKFVLGRLVDYFYKIGYHYDVPINALYTTLFKTIMSKSAVTEEFSDSKSCFEQKTLCRSEIDALLECGLGKKRFHNCWPTIERELIKDGSASRDIVRTKNACLSYITERAAGLYEATRFSAAIRKIVAEQKAAIDGQEWIMGVFALLHMATSGSECLGYQNDRLRGALIVESYEAMDG